MAYGAIKVDNITFTNGGADQATTVSGIYRAITSGVTVTGTISGATIQGTIVSGATVTGTTANFTSGVFTVLSGASTTVTSGIFAAGSAAAPSISFASDSNTGIYSPGADTLAFTEGGVEALRIDNLGKVGIGTTSPSYTLDVVGSSYVSSSSLAQYFGINATGAAGGVANGLFAPAGSTLGFVTNLTERMRIDSNGNVGIGTTPSASYRLDVQGGNARIYAGGVGSSLEIGVGATGNQYAFIDLVGDTIYNDYGLRLIRDDTGPNTNSRLTHRGTGSLVIATEDLGKLIFATNSIERMQVASNGNVGIGTSSPTSLLNCYGGASTTDTRITVNNAAAAVQLGIDATNDAVLATNISNSLIFLTNSTERMRLNSVGDVLIGKTTASATGNGVFFVGAGGSQGQMYSTVSSTINTYHVYSSASSTFRFYVNENGGVSNFSGNNVNLSDEREKKNISSLDSTWDCLKHWELKEFHYNEDVDTSTKRYGVIAQQVAVHCPEVISTWITKPAIEAIVDENGVETSPAQEEVVRLGVKEQQMYWMAIKALQEAQARIEALENRLAAAGIE